MCICVWACAHKREGAENSEGLDPLELELWVAMSCLTWGWELNLYSLQEQYAFLTSKSSLQLLHILKLVFSKTVTCLHMHVHMHTSLNLSFSKNSSYPVSLLFSFLLFNLLFLVYSKLVSIVSFSKFKEFLNVKLSNNWSALLLNEFVTFNTWQYHHYSQFSEIILYSQLV